MEISKAAMAKADRLVEDGPGGEGFRAALARVLQQHSDAAKEAIEDMEMNGLDAIVLRALILPDEPDKLEEAWSALWPSTSGRDSVKLLRAEIAKRGGRIVFDD